MKQETRFQYSYIYQFTGNPFVDGGITALWALSGKSSPQEITREDLKKSAEFVINVYPNWSKLRYLFTQNCLLLNPAIKNKAERYDGYLKDLIQKISNASAKGDCAICGTRDSDGLVLRQQYPLTGSGDLVNYFSFFEQGLALCPACTFALQFLPLYLISNDGVLFLAHSSDQRFMLDLAKKALFQIRSQRAIGKKQGYYLPFSFAKNERYELTVKLCREMTQIADKPYGRVLVRMYSFMNSGQMNFLNFIDLPADVFDFMGKSQIMELGKKLDYFLRQLSPGIFRAIIEEKNVTYYFLRLKSRELVGGWDLFELYLVTVIHMDKKRLDVLKKVGNNLYDFLKVEGFKKLKDLESIDKYQDLRVFLTKAQKEHLILELDDEPDLFPESKDGAIKWRETWSILLAYIYERRHKEEMEVKS
jgi:CRISPR-associated protein Cst1